MNEKLEGATRALVKSYTADGTRIDHLDRQPLPSHAEIIRVLVTIHELLFPGYIGAQGLTGESLQLHVESRMIRLYEVLTEQFSRAICHGTSMDSGC
ncbi:MAG TPA: hypothetical protein VE842_10075, partial [Pyrinomonadaceae bacterium]|nr:hypothetical protein [Pyrinomonadaceae bacterium]